MDKEACDKNSTCETCSQDGTCSQEEKDAHSEALLRGNDWKDKVQIYGNERKGRGRQEYSSC